VASAIWPEPANRLSRQSFGEQETPRGERPEPDEGPPNQPTAPPVG